MSTSGWEGILRDGEEVVWQGSPRKGIVIRPTDIFLSVFGLFFGGFAIVWMGMAGWMGSQAPGPMGLFWMFGIPFLLVGIWMFAGRYFWASYLRGHTFYTLTTQRAFIAVDAPIIGRQLKDYPITPDSQFELASHDTVNFATRRVQTKNGSTQVPVGFVLVDEPTKVLAHFDQVRSNLRNAEGTG